MNISFFTKLLVLFFQNELQKRVGKTILFCNSSAKKWIWFNSSTLNSGCVHSLIVIICNCEIVAEKWGILRSFKVSFAGVRCSIAVWNSLPEFQFLLRRKRRYVLHRKLNVLSNIGAEWIVSSQTKALVGFAAWLLPFPLLHSAHAITAGQSPPTRERGSAPRQAGGVL